jgi:hypothetical protein
LSGAGEKKEEQAVTIKSGVGGPPLLSTRSALVLLIALIVGYIAGTLAYLSRASPPAAVLYAGGAFGAALVAANRLIGP